MKSFFISIAVFCLSTAVFPQDSMLDFGKKDLKKETDKIKALKTVDFHFSIDKSLQQQAYIIAQAAQNKILLSAGDSTGLMYACLELAEQIRINKSLPSEFPIVGRPYIRKRGLKFNIPLDIRNPSYQDAGDAAQHNIKVMWEFDFWSQYLDMMARNRYNVLTLWNPHPFPSMIKLKDYPDAALEDICGTSFPLDKDRTDEPTAQFIAGCGISRQVLDNLIILKKISIEDKIEFWKKVMSYAKNRGVKVYFITWNIWMNSLAPAGWYRDQKNKKGTEGKYGINNDQENLNTISYLRESVKQFILTYPDLAGIGVTAGENMEDRTDEFDREKWLWATYGEGIMDAKKLQPGRRIEFIHRHWQSGVDKMVNDFISKYPDDINLSFKYARARMYATPSPRWADSYIDELKQHNLKSWWNVRNDDIFHFRWGDPSFTSAFIRNFPPQVTEGYFMGSDSYVWGREFTSKHPASPRQLETEKHWFNFMLWGRMGYNPDISQSSIEGWLAQRYKGVNSHLLLNAWATSSRITSLATRFHWHDWDFMWAVEGCLDLRKGFHTVEDFINKPPMQGSGIIGIPAAVKSMVDQSGIQGITPLQVAAALDSLGDETLAYTKAEHLKEEMRSEEFRELLYDMDAFAYLGKYYADKITAAYNLHAYRVFKDDRYRENAVTALQSALSEWKSYAASATRNYHPQFLSKTRTIDWNKLAGEVEKEWQALKNTKNNQ